MRGHAGSPQVGPVVGRVVEGEDRGGHRLLAGLVNRSSDLRDAIHAAEKRLDDMGWAEKVLPEFIGGKSAAAEKKLNALKHAYVSTMENELGIMKDFDDLIHSARQTLKALESPRTLPSQTPILVYWKDETGEHSFSTKQFGVA